MKMFFAGLDGSETINTVLRGCGVVNRLESYFGLEPKPMSVFPNMMLDSGGFSARRRNVTISVEKYAEYINTNKVKIAFELDTNDVKETAFNLDFLVKNTKAKIIPIYHYSDWADSGTELLDRLMKNFDYIGIGGLAKTSIKNKGEEVDNFLKTVFYRTQMKVKVHGLGITGKKLLERFPFYSVDSTSWQHHSRYGATAFRYNHKVSKQIADITDYRQLDRSTAQRP